jgi:hypothetical protein
MLRFLFISYFVFSLNFVSAQLNCESKSSNKIVYFTSCKHLNGNVSTIESWDSLQRFGTFKVYDKNKLLLCTFSLRKIGGHASVSTRYYSNGQVSKIEYSDQPDGGIHYYESTTFFDENGKQTGFSETKYPEELRTFVKEAPKAPVVEKCATLYSEVYLIKNQTRKKLQFVVTKLNPYNQIQDSIFVEIKPFHDLVIDTLFSAMNSQKSAYNIRFLVLKGKKPSEKFVIHEYLEQVSTQTKNWIWIAERSKK